ncbi:MAG TPA: hypothetical protein VFU88_22510 [Ktedonobacterales bacterium]|nr:hypothetical protein [Ktedonobacterales bacterium]
MWQAFAWPMVVVLFEAFVFVLMVYFVWAFARSHEAEWPAAEVEPATKQTPALAPREREAAPPEGELAHTA